MGRAARRTRGGALAVLALTCSLALAGCGSSSTSKACSLLDQAGIKDATGVAVQRGKIDADATNETQSTCAWHPQDGEFPVIQVYLSAGGEQVAQQRSDADSGYGVPSVDVTIAGARDAYAAGNGSLIGMVVGDYFVQVAYITPGTADALDKTTPLATKVSEAF